MPELVARLVDHPAIRPIHQLLVVIGIDVREIDQIRVKTAFLPDGGERGFEGPEALAEPHLLLIREVLVVEHEHGAVLERRGDRPEGRVVQAAGEIDALDTRAEMREQGSDGHRHGSLLIRHISRSAAAWVTIER